MFDPFAHEDAALDFAITRAYARLADYSEETAEYQQIVKQLENLHKLQNDRAQLSLKAQKEHADHQLECDKNAWKEEQDQRPFYRRVDPTAALTVAGNFAIALLVIKYEDRAVLTTKVHSFLFKKF